MEDTPMTIKSQMLIKQQHQHIVKFLQTLSRNYWIYDSHPGPGYYYFPPLSGTTAHSGLGPPHYRGFTITLRHTTLGRTPLDEWWAQHRDLYLTTHNPHKRQTSMPPAGFKPTILASERLQTHALDRTATGIGTRLLVPIIIKCKLWRTLILLTTPAQNVKRNQKPFNT
jgi:hypothetical protein